MKRLVAVVVAIGALAGSAAANIGPESSPYVSDPQITSASYNTSTKVLTVGWTLGTAVNGGFNLDLQYQTLSASRIHSLTQGVLTYPTPLWRSDDQTRFNTSIAVTGPLVPATYWLQLSNDGVVDTCGVPPCPPNPPTAWAFHNYSPLVSFVVNAPPPLVRCVVPKVVGSTLAAAKRKLAARHCRAGRVSYGRSHVRRGRVYWQSRRPGARLPKGTAVALRISR